MSCTEGPLFLEAQDVVSQSLLNKIAVISLLSYHLNILKPQTILSVLIRKCSTTLIVLIAICCNFSKSCISFWEWGDQNCIQC